MVLWGALNHSEFMIPEVTTGVGRLRRPGRFRPASGLLAESVGLLVLARREAARSPLVSPAAPVSLMREARVRRARITRGVRVSRLDWLSRAERRSSLQINETGREPDLTRHAR